jgi:NadR type nicotinamide-nucleotide adenylyltransferase
MEERTKNAHGKIIRIAITGPESTGKSLLAAELSSYYHTFFAPEYARNYIASLDREYNFRDLCYIAKRQIASENIWERRSTGYLFCDTELTVIKIWAEHRYHKCPKWVLKNISEIKYDLYLLCDIDLPWVYDPQREHPKLREYFFNKYRDELVSRNLPFVVISGTGKQRTQNAIDAIDALIK